jgi:hypothetical protein
MAKEEWRPFPDERFADSYEVSSHGRVRRIRWNGRTYDRPTKLTPSVTKDGYLRARLCIGSECHRVTFSVHRLVMAAFVGPCPDGMVVNHIDGDKQNNTLGNLEYVTHKENVRHAFAIGLSSYGRRGTETHLKRLRTAWQKATSDAKRQFLSEVLASEKEAVA